MTATKQDIESSYLNARAKFREWKDDYAQRYGEPSAEQELLAVWKTMTPEQHAMAQQTDPQKYAQVEQLAKQLEVKNARIH